LIDAGNNVLYFGALGQGAVALAVLSHYLAPVLVALLAPWLCGEAFSRRTLPAALGGLLGLALLLAPWRAQTPPRAVLLGAASAVFSAAYVITGKRLGGAFAPLELAVYHSLVSAVVLTPLGAAALFSAPLAAVLRLAAAAAVLGLLAGMAFYAGLARIPA